MRGFPLVGGFLRALAAISGPGSRGPWVGASGLPGHLMNSDVYWTILDALLFLITSPGKAGLRVQSGDRHTRDYGAACRGPLVVRERSGIVQTLRPTRILGPIGMER
jgi:hypothetical protein